MTPLQTALLAFVVLVGWAFTLMVLWALLYAYANTLKNVDQYP